MKFFFPFHLIALLFVVSSCSSEESSLSYDKIGVSRSVDNLPNLYYQGGLDYFGNIYARFLPVETPVQDIPESLGHYLASLSTTQIDSIIGAILNDYPNCIEDREHEIETLTDSLISLTSPEVAQQYFLYFDNFISLAGDNQNRLLLNFIDTQPEVVHPLYLYAAGYLESSVLPMANTLLEDAMLQLDTADLDAERCDRALRAKLVILGAETILDFVLAGGPEDPVADLSAAGDFIDLLSALLEYHDCLNRYGGR